MAKINDSNLKSILLSAYEAKEKGASLDKVFEKHAKKYGMAKGSVRNVYYNALKKVENSLEYKSEMLGEKFLSAGKIVAFKDEESDKLLEAVLKGVTFGKSVRKVIMEISSDEKMALRYQNKYRNLLKLEKDRVLKVCQQIKEQYGRCYNPYENKKTEDFNLARLKKEINALYERVSQRVKSENEKLKEKLNFYEQENVKLKNALEQEKKSHVNEYFERINVIKNKTSD
jgi:hypothetical protein